MSISIRKRVRRFLRKPHKHLRTDAYIVSYPKSGRTWLRVLIGKALCEKYNLPEAIMLYTKKVTSEAGILCTKFAHDSSGDRYEYYRLPTDKSKYAENKVIFLARDIKDILVSYYFHTTRGTKRKEKLYSGALSDLIRSDIRGARKVISFYNIWHGQREVPKEFLLIRYEDMHEKTDEVLAQVLHFLGAKNIERHIIETAVQFASFNSMKKKERAGFFKHQSMKPRNINEPESYKVRKGVVGGYKSYLSQEDIKYIDELRRELGCPFLLEDESNRG